MEFHGKEKKNTNVMEAKFHIFLPNKFDLHVFVSFHLTVHQIARPILNRRCEWHCMQPENRIICMYTDYVREKYE